MASENGSRSRERDDSVKKKKTPPRRGFYFYLGGELHKHIHINRGSDLITCWNFPEGRTRRYPWSETKRLMRPAFSTSKAGELINRSRTAIMEAIREGNIRQPYKPYSLDEERRPGYYAWSDDDVMEARDYFASQHYGYPRKDGLITPKPIPTRAELRAMMTQGITTYVRTSDGEFVPVFREIMW